MEKKPLLEIIECKTYKSVNKNDGGYPSRNFSSFGWYIGLLFLFLLFLHYFIIELLFLHGQVATCPYRLIR